MTSLWLWPPRARVLGSARRAAGLIDVRWDGDQSTRVFTARVWILRSSRGPVQESKRCTVARQSRSSKRETGGMEHKFEMQWCMW